MTPKVVVRCDFSLVDETNCDLNGSMTPKQLVKEWLEGFFMRPEPFQHSAYLPVTWNEKTDPLLLRIRFDESEQFVAEVDIGNLVTDAIDGLDDGVPVSGLRAFEKAMRELLDRVVAKVDRIVEPTK